MGAGAAGLSLAIWLRRLGASPLALEQDTAVGGQLLTIGNTIPDYPGLPDVAGPILAEQIGRHAQLAGVEVSCGLAVRSILPHRSVIETTAGPVQYSRLVIATGSRPRRLGVPGEMEMGRRGEVYSAAKHARNFTRQRVAVVGGGDRAVEGALLLAAAGASVILIHRSRTFRAQRHFVEQLMECENIEVRAPANLVRIMGEDCVRAIEVRQNGVLSATDVRAVLVRIGVVGNTEFVGGCVAIDENGLVVVDELCRTTASGIWAIGDVVARSRVYSVSTAVGHAALVAKQMSLEAGPMDYHTERHACD